MKRFQPFRPVGMAHGLIHFITKSWTGAPDEYEVIFNTNKTTMTCSCMDSSCRHKNYLPIGDSGLCKHSRLASEILWPILSRALKGVA